MVFNEQIVKAIYFWRNKLVLKEQKKKPKEAKHEVGLWTNAKL